MIPEEFTSWNTAHGVRYGMVNAPDKISRFFTAGTIYELPLLEWIYEQRHGYSTAIDAGANVGNHSLWMAAVCGLNVHAFEPVIPNALVANVELNNLWDKVKVYPVGLGQTVGDYHHVSKGVLQPGRSKQTTDEIVKVVTLDSLRIEQVSIMKIDVEGLELDVLQGGLLTIDRWKPDILCEEWEARTTRQIAHLLGPKGYTRIHGLGGKGRAPMGIWRAAA